MIATAHTTPLRWGIAATGSIAASMCEALRTLPEAEIVAVGSRTQDAADSFARRFGIDRAHGSYEALWADDDVDIVYIASPHSHHRDMTIGALDAGKHVLCEKAFAINAAQAREMVDAALGLAEDTKLMILAPVAREKKGEFLELFADMQAQGYVRFRVDGAVVEAADVPKLKKAEKHDIDVVIDRLKVRPDTEPEARGQLRQDRKSVV